MARVYLLLSFDDASQHMLKCAKIIEKHGLKGTFYLDCKGLGDLTVSDVRWLGDLGEVGSHTLTHSDLTTLDPDRAFYELVKSKEVLESILERKVESLAYPYGRYNDTVVRLTRRAGYICARTTKPFSLDPFQDPFRLKVTFYTDPHAFRDFFKALWGLRFSSLLFKPWLIKYWDKLIRSFLKELEKRKGIYVLHVLVHPSFIAKRDNWGSFEDLVGEISSYNMVNLTVSEFVKRMIRGSL